MSLDDRIRSIDPAQHVDPLLASSVRARSSLARIVANKLVAEPQTKIRVRSKRRHIGWYTAGATAAAGALLFTPGMGGSDMAYAGWVATARPATTAELNAHGVQCIQDWSAPGAQPDPAVAPRFTLALMEMRGDFAYAVLRGGADFEATCLVNTRPGSTAAGGYMGPVPEQPTARGLVTNGVREHSDRENRHVQYEVTGKAGSEVVAVTVHAPGVAVNATVQNGWFAAWWPGAKDKSLFAKLTHRPPNPDITLTYRDGSTRRTPIQKWNPGDVPGDSSVFEGRA